MLQTSVRVTKTILLMLMINACTLSYLRAGDVGIRPTWWFGVSGGINYNMYDTEIRTLNNTLPVLTTPFGKGSGIGFAGGPLLEFRPDAVWGGMLNLNFDARGGDFDDAASQKLSASMNYLSIEPSLRITPFGPGLHFFAGPTISFNVAKSLEFTPAGGTAQSGDWGSVRGTLLGGKAGIGYDFPLSSPDASWQVELTPYASAHFGQQLRELEQWSNTTLRGGLAIKFGTTTIAREKAETEVSFFVRSPGIVPTERRVTETFPIRNYIFFDAGSARIPSRYVQLMPEQAAHFSEEALLEAGRQGQTGRSAQQMQVYYNTLNIIGDRMRRLPTTTITLIGSSDAGEQIARVMAESIKEYLGNTFGIEGRRINVRGQLKPPIPSHQPGGTRELDLVKAEDRRVEITSESLDLLSPVRIIVLQEDPLDADIVLSARGAEEVFSSWRVEVTDERGRVKPFGPFTSDQERIPGTQILGDFIEGTYTVTMIGTSSSGATVRKEQTIRLARAEAPAEQMGLRYSILFEFDQSKTVATYNRFLRETVVSRITDGANVIIHGHTDIVGEESHNLKLSRSRATETMNILHDELNKRGKRRITFDTFGFGEDVRRAPFENRLPEERFYNRTVIIDIVPQ